MHSPHLETLTEIRNLMERSSRFISLSGLSGIWAGIVALAGAAVAAWYLDLNLTSAQEYAYLQRSNGLNTNFLLFFFADALSVIFVALGGAVYFTTRKARKQGLPVWDNTVRRMLVNLSIPLVTGGLFCLALVLHGYYVLIAPATLIFYGLSLINASKYTLRDLKALGMAEILLGISASFMTGFGLLFWAMGFGVLHIVYGTLMYYKYDR
jgi:predicted lysophospholipase L1 biosynthesis ABC-type transport system permease subunit